MYYPGPGFVFRGFQLYFSGLVNSTLFGEFDLLSPNFESIALEAGNGAASVISDFLGVGVHMPFLAMLIALFGRVINLDDAELRFGVCISSLFLMRVELCCYFIGLPLPFLFAHFWGL